MVPRAEAFERVKRFPFVLKTAENSRLTGNPIPLSLWSSPKRFIHPSPSILAGFLKLQ